MTAPSFAAYLRDPHLSGPEWQKPTRAPWHVLARILSGEKLTRVELRLFRACTGLQRVPRNLRTLIGLIGRRGGKSHFLAALSVWIAVFGGDWANVLTPGERGVVLLLAPSRKQAQLLARYAIGLCQNEMISGLVERQTAEEIEFSTGAVIETGVSDYRTIRGRTILATIYDEGCFAAEEGASPLEEVLAAAEPGMATVPGGGWLALSSSPWKPRGLMHKRWKDLHGQQDACDRLRAICWVASSQSMNPSLPKGYVERKMAEDPVKARCEYVVDPSSPWRSTDADFVPDDAIQACTDWEVFERPPESGVKYFAFTDAAGGSGLDSFCLAIAHVDGNGRAILDAARERKPRFVPSAVVSEYAALMKRYKISEVTGDHFSGGYVRNDYASQGITYRPSKLTKSAIYLAALPMLLNGKARLLDLARLRTQLSSLERICHTGGRESVDASGPEDLANAAMGALVGADNASHRQAAIPIFTTYATALHAAPANDELPPPHWVQHPKSETQALAAAAYRQVLQ